MFQLPTSRLYVTVRSPTGMEELLLREADALDVGLSLMLISRLVQMGDGSTFDWGDLPATDAEALLLRLRLITLGDRVNATAECASTQCAAKVDVSFRLGEYLSSKKARTKRDVERIEPQGWFKLTGENVRFRLPTCADQVAFDHEQTPDTTLIRRCIEPANISSRLRRKVESAMEAMAPRLSQLMLGCCPECKAVIRFYFDVHSFVLQELRNHAGTVYQDVHLLELPRARRLQYVDMIRDQEAVA